MKLSQSQIILKVLEDRNDWIISYDLTKVATKFGWIGTSGDRRCRELAEDGIIERKHEGGYVWYRSRVEVEKPRLEAYSEPQKVYPAIFGGYSDFKQSSLL